MTTLSFEDLHTICEIAGICLADDADRITVAENLDLSDDELKRISLLVDAIMKDEKPLCIPFALHEKGEVEHPRTINSQIRLWKDDFGVSFEGYGSCDVSGEEAEIVAVELYDDHLRVMTWSDISREDPLVIHMEEAREEKRPE